MKRKLTEKQLQAGLKNLEKGRTGNINNLKFFNSKTGSKSRLSQLKKEESMAENLRKQGYEVFSPTVVCDRIAIKDNKVYFVEFKKEGQKLRPGQQLIYDLVSDNYLIIYADK